MKRSLLLITLLCVSFFIHAQTSDSTYIPKDTSVIYYNQGIEAFKAGQLTRADSLFTLSLKLQRHPDTYYSRAVTRRKLKNVKGYCIDLGNAANMNDKEAGKLFWKDCGSVDTIYYDEIGSRCKPEDMDTYEILGKSFYTTDQTYKLYDNKKQLKTYYEVTNNDTIYYRCDTPPEYPGGDDNALENIRYILNPTRAEAKGQRIVYVLISIMLSEKGDITDIEVYSSLPSSQTNQVAKIFKKYSNKWEGAKHNGKSVKFRKFLPYAIMVT